MKHIILVTGSICLAFAGSAHASQKPSVNDMSACQATADFVVAKTTSLKSKYPAADVSAVIAPLEKYSDFIQSEHITPGLLDFNGGDAAKATAMQKEVSNYQKTLAAALESKFGGDRLYTDQAMSLDGCYSKAPMDADMTGEMTTALQTLVKLAMMK